MPIISFIIKPTIIKAAYKAAREVLDLSEYTFDFLDAEYKELKYDGDEATVTFAGLENTYKVTIYLDGGVLREIRVN